MKDEEGSGVCTQKLPKTGDLGDIKEDHHAKAILAASVVTPTKTVTQKQFDDSLFKTPNSLPPRKSGSRRAKLLNGRANGHISPPPTRKSGASAIAAVLAPVPPPAGPTSPSVLGGPSTSHAFLAPPSNKPKPQKKLLQPKIKPTSQKTAKYRCPSMKKFLQSEYPELPTLSSKSDKKGEGIAFADEVVIDDFSLITFTSAEDLKVFKRIAETRTRERQEIAKREQYLEDVKQGKVKKKGRKSKAQLEKEKKEEKRKKKLEKKRARKERREQRRRERREKGLPEKPPKEKKEKKPKKEKTKKEDDDALFRRPKDPSKKKRYQSPSFASAFASSSAPSTSHHPLHVQNPLHHSHPFGFYPHPQGPSSAATPDAMMKSPQQTPPNEIVAFGGVKRPSSVSSNGTPNGVLGGEQPALKLPRLDQVDEFNKHGSLIGIAVKSENGQILQNPSATPPSAQTPNGHSKTLTSLDCKPPAVTSAETCHPVDPGHRVLPLSSSSSTTPLGRPSSHTALGIGAPGAAFAQQNSSLFVHTSNADARLPPRPMNLVDPRMPHLNMLPFHQLPITNNPFLSASGAGVPFLQAHIASLSQQQQQQLAGVIPSTASAPTSAASTASSLTSASQNPFPQNASLGSQLAGAAVFGHKHLMGNATSSIPQNAGASRKGVWNGRHVKIAETVKANKNSHAELSAASSSSASTSTTPVTSTVNSIVSAPSMVAPPHHQQNAASVSANTSAAMHHAMQFSQHARNPPQNVLGASHPLMAPPLCPPSTSTASISGLTTGIAPGFAMQAAGYPHLAGRSSVTPKRDATLVPSNANPNRPPSTLTRNLVPNAQNAQNLHALAAAGLPSAAAHQLGINLPLAHQLSGSLTNGISDAAAAQAQVQAQAAQAQAQQLALIAALQGQSLPPGALQQLLAASQSNQVAASQAQPAPQTHHPGLAAAAGAAAHPALSFAAAAAANGGHPGLGTNSASALRLMTGADPAQMNSLLLLQQQMEASRANLAASQAQPASLHAAPTNLDVLRMQMEQQQQQHQAQQQQQHQQLAAQVQQQQLMERLSQQHHQNLASQHAAAQQQQQQLAAAAAASAASGGLDINLFRQQFANAQMRMNPLAMSQAGTDRMNLSQASSQLESMLENQRRMLQHQPHQLSQQGLPPGLVGLGANGVSLSGLYGGKMPFAANLEHLSRQQAAQQPKREDLLPNGGSRP